MENISNKNKKVLFIQDTVPIIDGIIEKYKLAETDQQIAEKISKGKLINGGILLDVTKKIVLGEILKTELPIILQKEFSVSEDIANNLAKEVQNQLLPIAKVFGEVKIISNEIPVNPNIKQFSPPKKIPDITNKKESAKEVKKTQDTNKKDIIKKESPPKNLSSTSDRYREPIE